MKRPYQVFVYGLDLGRALEGGAPVVDSFELLRVLDPEEDR
jgi:hypothetical protein